MSGLSFSTSFDPIDRNSGIKIIKPTGKSFTVKSGVNASPFVYGAKKVTFSVKQRTSFWETYFNFSENRQINRALILDYILDNSNSSPADILKKPVSPALALTLLLLNESVFKTQKLSNYLNGDKEAVYVNVEEGNTETYKCALPGYLKIHAAAITKGTTGSSSPFVNDTNKGGYINTVLPIFDKLQKSSYGVKSSDIEYLRGAYGYGPACIGAFLNICKFKKDIIPDLICGLLISEDSGMTVGDAKDAVDSWTGKMPQDSILNFSLVQSLGTFKILSILEEIGTYFLLSLLGHTFKSEVQFHFPLSASERKIFDTGFLFGDVNSDLIRFANYVISNRLYLEKSIEVFSISVPCIMNSEGKVVDSKLEMGSYTREFSGITEFDNNPLLEALKIGKCLDDIEDLEYVVNPTTGHSVSEFINKGINTCFINLVGQFIGLQANSTVGNVQSDMLTDMNIAPRDASGDFDYSYVVPDYQAQKSITLTSQTGQTLSIKSNISNSVFDGKSTGLDDSERTKEINYSDLIDKLYSNDSGMYTAINNALKDQDRKIQITYKYGALKTNNTELDVGNSTLTISKIVIPDFIFVHGCNTYKFKETTIEGNTQLLVSTVSNVKVWNLNSIVANSPNVKIVPIDPLYPIIKEKINKLMKDNNCTLQKQFYSIGKPEHIIVADDLDKVNIFLDKIGLAILRISLINSFCNSYSLDLTLKNDTMRRFYNIFTGYIKDYVDISVTTLK